MYIYTIILYIYYKKHTSLSRQYVIMNNFKRFAQKNENALFIGMSLEMVGS